MIARVPIRVRLTGWYVLVLAVVLAALGAFVVTRLRTGLTSEVDRSLRSAAEQIGDGYRLEGAPEFADATRSLLPVSGDSAAGAQVLDATGRVVLAEGGFAGRAALVDAGGMERVLGGDRLAASAQAGDPAAHVRIAAVPVSIGGSPQVVVAMRSLAEVDRSVHRVTMLLLAGGLVSLALAAAGGWWVARKALRPVERMATRADAIDIRGIAQRVPVPPAHDELGHLASTLNAMLKRLEDGVASRHRLIADASHELRGPLTAMRSEIEVSLRHDDLGDDARAVLTSARAEVVRLGRVVSDLLTLARVDDGRLDLLLTTPDLLEIARSCARIYAAAAAGIDLTVDGEPTIVTGDRDRLEQVVGNLVDNALRHAPPGGRVEVFSWRRDGEVGITVADDGPGVPGEIREHIFERFARGGVARGRDGGAGLGLAICDEIVRAHGGRIRVEDRQPHGCAFVVSLPALAGDDAQAPPAARVEGAG